MILVHAAELAPLELEEDLDLVSIFLSASLIVLVLCVSYRSAAVKAVVSASKSMSSIQSKYSIRLIESKCKICEAANDTCFFSNWQCN